MTKRKIIVSDIHGCFYTFQNLLNKVQYKADKDVLILLGDYVDRGKNTCELVSYIRRLQYSNEDTVICLSDYQSLKMLREERFDKGVCYKKDLKKIKDEE